mgnify:CR=1 FL=1|jgi:hypothetical protein
MNDNKTHRNKEVICLNIQEMILKDNFKKGSEA